MANQDLTTGNPGRMIRNYCLPLLGSVFFQEMYNLTDSFVAGRFIGENALAAVGNGYEITLIYLAFAFGCNTGCSVNTAREFGAKNYRHVRTSISTALIVTAATCMSLVILGLAFTKPLLRLIRTPESIYADSITYLRIYTYGLPFLFLYNIANGIFSALGDSKTPFYFLAVSSTANIVLDILFVSKFHMGVAGVGWATFICQGASCIPAACLIAKKIKTLPTEKASVITRDSLKDFFLVATPSASQRGIVVLGNMIIQGVVNSYGVVITTGYAVAIKLINLSTSFFGTIGTGVTNYTAQNLGAGSPQRVREGFKASVKLVWGIALVTCLLCEVFPETLVKVFLSEITENVKNVAMDFLRIASPFYFAPAIKIMCDSVLCGAKKMGLVVFSLALDLGLRALIAVIFSAIFHTAFSIWFAWPIGWVIAAVVTFALYKNGISELERQSVA